MTASLTEAMTHRPQPDAATVLVVDDEHANVLSLKKIFERENMRVLTAASAKDALELIRSRRVEVVLTDLMMPGTSGLDLLRAIRKVSPDVEVVMMTAHGTVETAVFKDQINFQILCFLTQSFEDNDTSTFMLFYT